MYASRTVVLASWVVLTLGGCSSAGVAPKIAMRDGFPGNKPRTIYVTTERDQAAVAASLEQAGFRVMPDPASAAYLLKVAVGTKRAQASCGTVNNVRYTLDTGAMSVLEIQARGWTGTCSPNVYDDMSATLASAFPPG